MGRRVPRNPRERRYGVSPAQGSYHVSGYGGLRGGLPPRTFLSINVPTGEPKGFRLTVQGKRNHVTIVDERCDPRGKAYYWIEEGENDWEPHDRSDYQAVRDGYISVTPLQPDMTDYEALEQLESLSIW